MEIANALRGLEDSSSTSRNRQGRDEIGTAVARVQAEPWEDEGPGATRTHRLPRFGQKTRRHLPPQPAGSCLTDNRFLRMWQLRQSYRAQVAANVRAGVPLADLLRTQFPYMLPTADSPPCVAVELTNFCQLSCEYCTSHLRPRTQGFMTEATLGLLTASLRNDGISRVAVVGLGEATTHLRFANSIRELGTATRFLSLTSNWHDISDAVIRAVVEAPVRLLNVSAGGWNDESYAASRGGGRLSRVVDNLSRLFELRRRPLVNIRVMLRPSEVTLRSKILGFWRQFADVVSIQHVVDFNGVSDDVYALKAAQGRFPRCTLPFKQLLVYWSGDVPMCTYIHHQADDDREFMLGNIREATLAELWRRPLMVRYRHAHRRRLPDQMPLCDGCGGC